MYRQLTAVLLTLLFSLCFAIQGIFADGSVKAEDDLYKASPSSSESMHWFNNQSPTTTIDQSLDEVADPNKAMENFKPPNIRLPSNVEQDPKQISSYYNNLRHCKPGNYRFVKKSATGQGYQVKAKIEGYKANKCSVEEIFELASMNETSIELKLVCQYSKDALMLFTPAYVKKIMIDYDLSDNDVIIIRKNYCENCVTYVNGRLEPPCAEGI